MKNSYYNFLKKLQFCLSLKNDEFFDFFSFKKFVLNLDLNYINNNQLNKVLKFLWENFNFTSYVTCYDFSKRLKDFNLNFNNLFNNRCNEFFKVIEITENCEVYPKNYNKIKSKINQDELIHDEDEIILFDANYLASKSPFDLYLVTGDKNFFKRVMKIINLLFIKGSKSLKEFI